MKFLLSLLVLAGLSSYSNAQCPYTASSDFCPDLDASTFTVGVPNAMCGTTWGGEHDQVNNMVAGCTYLVESCGVPYDSEITVFADGGGAALGYSGTGCGDDASFNFIPPANGNYEFQITQQGCGANATNSPMTITLVSCPVLCTDPTVPSALSASPSTICPSGNSTLSWTGTLNDATNWHIYTGSCGGTQIGTSATNSFVVSPSVTTTYYIRGEDGAGCVDESTGLCGQVTVTVADATPPTITCPGNQTGSVNASCNFTLPDYTGLAVAADNCGSVTVTQSPVAGTNVGTGTTVITLTANDGNGNTANCNFNVVVSDITNPTITCPGNQTGSVDASCNFSLPDYTALATPADNCPGVVVTQVPAPGTNVGIGTTNIVLTATDGSSNTANCNFDVVVSDNTNPTITCPGNQIGSVDASCNFSLPDYTALATPADNCPGVTVTQVPLPGTIVGVGTTNIVLTATDGSSNTANCNFDVVVSDNTNPTITCPGNQLETPDASCNFTLPDYTALATAADNCPGVTVTQSPLPGTVISGNTTITLTATDGNSNTANCNFDVIINDVTPPSAICQNINVYLDGAGNATITAADIDGGSTDNCAGLTLSASQTAFTCADLGSNNVTLTATDGNLNSDNCLAVVTVLDTVSPVITCPGNQTESPDASCNFTLPDYTSLANGTDNCGSATITQSPVAGTVISGTTTITMTADDGNGNTAACQFDVILNDATAPTAVCQNINVYLDGAGNASIVAADIDGGSTDNCAGLTLSASTTTFTCADLGTNNVTLTVTDGNSNSSNCVAVVTVLDTISPVATCPGNQTELAGALCDFVLPDYTGLVTASDNCGSATITQSPVAGTTITADQTITMTTNDGNGNTSTCTFDVVLDFSACAGAECSNAIALAPMAPCGDTQSVSGSTVGGTPSTEAFCGTSTGTGGASWYTFTGDGADWTASTVSGGTNYDTKLWIFEGACGSLNCVAGNDDFSGVQSQVTFPTTVGLTYYVIVGGYSSSEGNYDLTLTNTETVPPVADAPSLADVLGECEVTSLTAPTALDNCSGALVGTHNATLPITTQGTTIVTWTYTDGAGNTSTQMQNVILDDVTNPVIPTLADLAGDCSMTIVAPTTTDNCAGTITGTTTDPVTFTADGTYVVNWTFDDGGGNTVMAAQNVTIDDVTDPAIPTLADVTVDCSTIPTAPTTTDDCAGTITGTTSTIFPVPTSTTVTWIFDDGNGNSVTADQDIIVNDGDSPIPLGAPLPDVTGECSVTSLPAAPTAWDACAGTIIGTTTATGPWTSQGTFTITWAFDDGNGNIAYQGQDIVVNDVTAPVADAGSLTDLTGLCSVDAPASPTATDNCEGSITGTPDVSFPITTIGTTVITWTFDDGNGNTSTQIQNVIVTGVDVSTTVASDSITANNGNASAYQWIDCILGFPFTGETNQSFTPTTNGEFAVVITENGCTDTSACIVINNVGLDHVSITSFTMYPNPTLDGVFSIDYEGEISQIDVVDMVGRKISLPVDLKEGTVDGSKLLSGRYIVRILTGSGQMLAGEIIVQK